MIEILGAAALMGLVGSPHCVGMCGPFALACGGRPSHVGAWQLGKLGTYAALGSLAGAFGSIITGPAWIAQVVSAAFILWFAAVFAGLAPEPSVGLPGLARLATRVAGKEDLRSRVLFGAANGLLPCGLVYAALGLAVVAGRATQGALVMIAFGVGTAPLPSALALSTRRVLARRPMTRRALAVALSLAGLWVVVRRGGAHLPIQ